MRSSRIALSFIASVSLLSIANANEWKLRLLDNSKWPNAVCLDGSPGAYYVREGIGQPEKVFFMMQGGGWCLTRGTGEWTSCLLRSRTSLGSSCNNWATGKHNCSDQDDDPSEWTSLLNHSYLSTNSDINPAFSDWTMIIARYCDGTSFSGRLDEPVQVLNENGTNSSLYYRGNYILEAITHEALELKSSSSSRRNISHLVVGGWSSGGLATYLHSHQVTEWVEQSSQLETTPEIAYFIEAGFFPQWNETDFLGSSISYDDWMKVMFSETNVTDSLPKKCLEEKKNPYFCMFAQHVVEYLEKPYFTFQSNYDSNELATILGWNESVGVGNGSISMKWPWDNTVTADLPFISWSDVKNYSQNLLNLLLTSTKTPEVLPVGIFVPPCLVEITITDTELYTHMTASGVAYNKALASWLDEWLSGSPAIPGKENLWIHSEEEGPFTKKECSIGMDVRLDTIHNSKNDTSGALKKDIVQPFWIQSAVFIASFFFSSMR